MTEDGYEEEQYKQERPSERGSGPSGEASFTDQELDRNLSAGLDEFADMVAEEVKGGGDLEGRDAKVERARQKAREDVGEYCDRFSKGYEALLQELMSVEDE